MAATLRVKRTRLPLAETLNSSPMLEPLNCSASVPALAFDGVAAVARVPLEGVVAGAQKRGVGALVAVDEVIAGAGVEGVGAVAAEQPVVARAAFEGERLVGHVADDGDLVVAVAGVDVHLVERAAVELEVDRAVGADVERERRPVRDDRELVRRPCCRRPRAWCPAPRRCMRPTPVRR